MKRSILFVLSVLMIISILPVNSIFASDIEKSGNCGSGVTYTLYKDGTLVISGNGKMTDYNTNSILPWDGYSQMPTKLIIEEGVTHVGDYAFEAMAYITSVSLPSTLISIGSNAFTNCIRIPEINLPDSLERVGEYAFYSCDSIKSITFPKNVISLGQRVLQACSSLEEVTVKSGSIGDYFCWNCSKLNKLTLGNKVTSIGRSSFERSKITELVIPDSADSIGEYAFAHNEQLKTLVIGTGLKTIPYYSFGYCTSLDWVTMPRNITAIEKYAFYDSYIRIRCYKNSYAEDYAVTNDIAYEYLVCKHEFTNYVYDNNATCTKDGTKTARCNYGCGETDTVTAANTKTDHKEGNWTVTKEPTVSSYGERVKYCVYCSMVMYTEQIDKLTVIISFPDVPRNAWYYEGVTYCAGKGYITGTDKGTFDPNASLTREQFVVILARVAGANLNNYKASVFSDVKSGQWFAPSVSWAANMGYVGGIGNGKFGTGKNLTRQELATLFYRYAENNGKDVSGRANLNYYSDNAKIASWARTAVSWAVDAGLLSSTNQNILTMSPTMAVTRAQAAKIFMSYDNIK